MLIPFDLSLFTYHLLPVSQEKLVLMIFRSCLWKKIGSLYFFVAFFFFFYGRTCSNGSSQARGQSRFAGVGLRHSHSHIGYELCLRPTPQLMATLDPYPTEGGQGLNLHPHYAGLLAPSGNP